MGLHFEFQNQNQQLTDDTSKRQSFIEGLALSSHQRGESSAPSTEERVHSRGKKLYLVSLFECLMSMKNLQCSIEI